MCARLCATVSDVIQRVVVSAGAACCSLVSRRHRRRLQHHVEDPDADARRLTELLATFDVHQHSHSSTHRCGGTLDLVMTLPNHPPSHVSVDPAGLITCQLPVAVGQAEIAERIVRGWHRVDRVAPHP